MGLVPCPMETITFHCKSPPTKSTAPSPQRVFTEALGRQLLSPEMAPPSTLPASPFVTRLVYEMSVNANGDYRVSQQGLSAKPVAMTT